MHRDYRQVARVIGSLSPQELFDPERYSAVRKPLLEASTLPPWCYTDERFFAREVERIFQRCWHFVGREDELAEPGDYLTFQGVGGPVLLIRGKDRVVRAFSNTCRHRGTQLVAGSGHVENLVCPYHSWVYSSQGELLRAPGMDESKCFDKQQFPLLSVRVESWAGFLFVCYDPDAPALHDYLGNMPAFFAAYEPERLQVVRRFEFDIQCNWKFVTENALEAYHTGTVHRDSLGKQESRAIDCEGNWDALFVYVDDHENLAVLPGESTPFPTLPNLSGEQRRGTYFTDIYPCTQFVFANDCMWWLAFQPRQVNQTHLTLGACFPPETIALPAFEGAVERYYHRWCSATPEDNQIAEWQQAGNATGAPAGRFHKDEALVHRLSNWVLDRVLNP